MVYNKDVTKLNVYVLPNDANESPDEVKADVANQLDKMIKDWTTSICPSLARFATPPVAFKDIHAGMGNALLTCSVCQWWMIIYDYADN